MNSTLFWIIYFTFFGSLIIFAIFVGYSENNKIKKIIEASKYKNSQEFIFKDILAAYTKYYNWNWWFGQGMQTQLRKIYKANIVPLEKEKLMFISFGLKNFTFQFYIITQNYFVHFSKKEGLIYFTLKDEHRIKNYILLQQNFAVQFSFYMKKAFDLHEYKTYLSSFSIIREKVIYFSRMNYDNHINQGKEIIWK